MSKNSSIKKVLIIIVIIILVCAIIGIIAVNMNTKQRATRKLNKLGEKFYNYYYDDNYNKEKPEEVKVFLSQYADTGVTITLKHLREYMDTKKVENYGVFESCDQTKTKVIVHPYAPYGKKDRTIEISLDCKF